MTHVHWGDGLPLAGQAGKGVEAFEPASASVSRSRSAASANSAVPVRDDSPVRSAGTSTLTLLERPITRKVTS
jgi:hypothetical protein